MGEEMFSFMAFGLSHGNGTDFVFSRRVGHHPEFFWERVNRGKKRALLLT
jgi:hypothetical protein